MPRRRPMVCLTACWSSPTSRHRGSNASARVGERTPLPHERLRRSACGAGGSREHGSGARACSGRSARACSQQLWRWHTMRYLYRRLSFYLVALWAAVTLNFAIPRLMPGNPAEVFLASHYQQFQGDPHALQTIEAVLGVSHDPMPVQYCHYLLALVHGGLGISTSFYPAHVSTVSAQSLPWTILLVGFAPIIAFVLGTRLG